MTFFSPARLAALLPACPGVSEGRLELQQPFFCPPPAPRWWQPADATAGGAAFSASQLQRATAEIHRHFIHHSGRDIILPFTTPPQASEDIICSHLSHLPPLVSLSTRSCRLSVWRFRQSFIGKVAARSSRAKVTPWVPSTGSSMTSGRRRPGRPSVSPRLCLNLGSASSKWHPSFFGSCLKKKKAAEINHKAFWDTGMRKVCTLQIGQKCAFGVSFDFWWIGNVLTQCYDVTPLRMRTLKVADSELRNSPSQ